ncbi:MAG: hypothetical protein ACREC1_10630 [Methylovirgula sp.]
MTAERVALEPEVRSFETTADKVALGDLAIRQAFARNILWLFIAANAFVFVALGVVFWQDCAQVWAGRIAPGQRIVTDKVMMSLLGATTVQLGAAIYTITRAIFPGAPRSQ